MKRIGFSAYAALVATACAADAGSIVGPNPVQGWCHPSSVVWALSSECLRSYRTVIDSEKGFAFQSLPAGTYKLYGVCDDGLWVVASRWTEDIRIEPGEIKTVHLEWRLVEGEYGEQPAPPSLPLSGRILDEAGRPLAGAIVTVHRRERDGGQKETDSESDGRFGFCRVSQGRLTLEVKRAGYLTVTTRIDVNIHNTKSLEIKLRRR
jgi:hypothetical protein